VLTAILRAPKDQQLTISHSNEPRISYRALGGSPSESRRRVPLAGDSLTRDTAGWGYDEGRSVTVPNCTRKREEDCRSVERIADITSVQPRECVLTCEWTSSISQQPTSVPPRSPPSIANRTPLRPSDYATSWRTLRAEQPPLARAVARGCSASPLGSRVSAGNCRWRRVPEERRKLTPSRPPPVSITNASSHRWCKEKEIHTHTHTHTHTNTHTRSHMYETSARYTFLRCTFTLRHNKSVTVNVSR